MSIKTENRCPKCLDVGVEFDQRWLPCRKKKDGSQTRLLYAYFDCINGHRWKSAVKKKVVKPKVVKPKP